MPAVVVIDLQTAMMDGVAFGPTYDHENHRQPPQPDDRLGPRAGPAGGLCAP